MTACYLTIAEIYSIIEWEVNIFLIGKDFEADDRGRFKGSVSEFDSQEYFKLNLARDYS
jgi:hypothetical protein